MSTEDPTDGYTDAELAELKSLEQGEADERSANGELSEDDQLTADEHADDVEFESTRDDKPSRLDEQAAGTFGDDLPPSMAPQSEDERKLRDVFPIDVEGHAKYPVEKARAYAADDLVPTTVYRTPWGDRAMGADEVNDLRRQGLTIEPVDSAPTESLEQDKTGMSHVEFGTREN